MLTRPFCSAASSAPGIAAAAAAVAVAVAANETSVRVRWRMSASVPDSTIRPRRMIETRSHSCSTSERMWLDSSTVAPAARTRAISSWKTTSISGSSPLVGSSRMYRSAGTANAAMSATFCRLPFEYARPFLRGSNWNTSHRRCFSAA